MTIIRTLFSEARKIDRRIEKVIDYAAQAEDRLEAEISEYEATPNVESCFRKFLETYQAGVQAGDVTEVGIWVSGFYGSGKSSFTKYLGFALDPARTIRGRPFLELLQSRLRSSDVRALLSTVARRIPTAVVMLDLGTDQLASSPNVTVANVLYWKVLQLAGFSREQKLAELEFSLSQRGLYEKFKQEYSSRFGETWEAIHNDPSISVARASQILPTILPETYPDELMFLKLKYEASNSVRDLAQRMIDLIRKSTGVQNILFLIDEAGQYVAPKGQLILNLDGLARAFKELGQGKVWIVATGQQTLSEIVESAAYNSAELNKLRDRFPIAIELDARDIREITYRRLLTKSDQGEKDLRKLFSENGQAMIWHTRLTGTSLYKDDPTAEDFIRFYPFLPQHFDVLMQLIRVLARRTGGVGLRSAIRVIQDVLVDTNKILPAGETKLADRPNGALATVADFYKTLRYDILKTLPHVVAAVDKVEELFPGNPTHIQAAQAVAALQLLDDFPRSPENIAALLYPQIGSPGLVDEIRAALIEMAGTRGLGLIEDPQSGGYQFLSESVEPLRRKRSEHEPTIGEVARVRNELLQAAIAAQPSARLEGVKEVPAGVFLGRSVILGDKLDINFQLEIVDPEAWEERRNALLAASTQATEYRAAILWMFRRDPLLDEDLVDICKSEFIAREIGEHATDRDLAQYARAEMRRAALGRESALRRMKESLLDGLFIFRGKPTPVRQAGSDLSTAAQTILAEAAGKVFHQYHLVKIRPPTNLAARFLEISNLKNMPGELDPLGLVNRQTVRIETNNPALTEALRAFKEKADAAGSGRLPGKAIQELFAAAPYGWSKDAVRYLFAALLVAGKVEFVVDGQTLRTAVQAAADALRSTVSFNSVGVGLRDSGPSPEALDRAARRMEDLFGEQVLPLEDHVAQAARKHFPPLISALGALPSRLRLLGLPGEERASELLTTMANLLKGDGSDAPIYLGAIDSELPQEIAWARLATRALDQDGEDDIRRARGVLTSLEELEGLFPGEARHLAPQEEPRRIREALKSENFAEKLADVRSQMQAVLSAARHAYQDCWDEYNQALGKAETALQNHPDWVKLEDADRAELASRLQNLLPTEPAAGKELNDYRTLLVRQRSLPALLQDLLIEVKRRMPEAPPLPPVSPNGDGQPIMVEIIDIDEILPRDPIYDQSELEGWLNEVRALVVSYIQQGKGVQFNS